MSSSCSCGLAKILQSEIIRVVDEMEAIEKTDNPEKEGLIACRMAIMFELSDILSGKIGQHTETKIGNGQNE